MALNLDIPQIDITLESDIEGDEEAGLLSLADALTDIEDLYEDGEEPTPRAKPTLRISLREKEESATDLEDFEASDNEQASNIVPHEKPIVLEDMDLEPGLFEETVKKQQRKTKRRPLKSQVSKTKNEQSHLGLNDFKEQQRITDVENFDTDSDVAESVHENADIDLNVESYSCAGNTSVSENVQGQPKSRRKLHLASPAIRINDLTDTEVLTSDGGQKNRKPRRKKRVRISKNDVHDVHTDVEELSGDGRRVFKRSGTKPRLLVSAQSLNFESDYEGDTFIPFPLTKQVASKKPKDLHIPDFEAGEVTDVEDMESDIDIPNYTFVENDTVCDQILEEMSNSYSLTKEQKKVSQKQKDCYAKIRVCKRLMEAAAAKKIREEDAKKTSSSLGVPQTDDGGTTDVEKLGSSSEDEEEEDPIPYELPKSKERSNSEGTTDDELINDTENLNLNDNDDVPEIELPKTTRTLIIFQENDSSIPRVQVLPLTDNDLLTVKNNDDDDGGLTDEEVFQENELYNFEEIVRAPTPNIQFSDCGSIDYHENVMENISVPNTTCYDDDKSDVEDLFTHSDRQRNTRTLQVFGANESDYEDASSSYFSDPSTKSNLLVVKKENIGDLTDCEMLDSADEATEEPLSMLNIPQKQMQGVTDTEDIAASTDDEYNLKTVSPPGEIIDQLDQMGSTEVNIEHKSKINYSAEEVMYLKGGAYREVLTDVEEFCIYDEEIIPDLPEWGASKEPILKPNQEPVVEADLILKDCGTILNSQITENHSYEEIEELIDKMFNDISIEETIFEQADSGKNFVNKLELLPSSEATIEIPIKKLEPIDDSKTKYSFANIDITFSDYDEPKSEDIEILPDFYDQIVYEDVTMASSESLDNPSSNRLKDNDYETIEVSKLSPNLCRLYDHDCIDDIWWEGTFRKNLSDVPEEDEEERSILSSWNSLKVEDTTKTLNPTKVGPIIGNLNSFDDTSSSSSKESSSSDEGQYELYENKHLPQIQGKTEGNIKIKSIGEYADQKNKNSKTLPSKISNKLGIMSNRLSNAVEANKKKFHSMPNITDKKKTKKPSFTLQNLFARTSNATSSKSNETLTKTNFRKPYKSNIIVAQASDNFPLSYDHAASNQELYRQEINKYIQSLYSQEPNYLSKSEETINSKPKHVLVRKETSFVSTSSIPDIEHPKVILRETSFVSTVPFCGESTATTQSLVNVGQLDNAVDDKHFLFDQTKTFIQNETFAEPYNAQSEKYVTFKPSEPIEPIEKPQVDAPKTKKPKKGIMGTIKTFVNKSLDHSDSDSEGKSPKKSKKKKTKSEPVQEKKVEPYPVKDFSESPKKETQPAKPTESKKRIFGFLDKSRKSEEKTIIVEEPPKMVESIVKINIEPPQDSFDETEDIVSQAKEVVEEIIVESQTKVQDLLEKQGICAKQESTNLIQNEIHFQGWSDDQYNICNPLKQLEEIDETPKQPELTDTPKKKQGKLFGLFGKSEKEPKREEVPLDKEKKKGIFGIFESPKKTKEPEDETREDLERRKDQIEEQIKSIEEELLKANKEKSFAEQFNLQKHTEKEEKVRETTTKVKTKDKTKTVNVHDEIKSIQEALIPDVKAKPVPEASLILTDSKPVKSVTFKPDDEQIDKTNEEFSVSVVENKTINQTQKSFTEQTKKDGEIVEETKVEKFIVTTSTLDNKQTVDIETKPVADLHNEENRATCNDFLQSEVANYYDHKENILPKKVEVDESDKKSKKGILQMFGIKQQSKDVDTEEKEKKKEEKKKEKRKEESPMRIFNIKKTKTEEKPLKVTEITEKPLKEPLISQTVPVLETPPTNGEVKETLTIIDVDELITEENRIKCNNFIQTEVKNYYDHKEPQQTPVVEEKEEKKEKKGILQMFGIKKSKDQDVADKEIAEPKQPKEIKKDKQKDTSPLRIFGKKKSEDHPEKKSEQTKVADEILQINENISDDSVKPVIETIIEDTPKTVTVIESVVKNIKKNSSEFLQNEKEQYEDSIRPTDAIENVTETISKTNVLKDPMQKAVVEVTPKKDVTPKQNIEQIPVQVPSLELTSLVDKDTRSKCNDFLKTETDRYYDYKDVSQSTVAKAESDKKSKKGHGILQIFGIKQKSKDIDASEKEIEEPKQSKDEKKKDKKKDSSPLRIFKKQKTEDQSIKSEKAIKESEELLEIQTKDSIKKEIKLEQTVQKKAVTEIDTSVPQIKPPSLELDTLVNKEHRIECNAFLDKEVENYYDHKEITPKDKEVNKTKHASKPEEVKVHLEGDTLKVNVSNITEQSKIDSDEFLNLEKKNYEDFIKTVSGTKTQETETKIKTADSLHKIVVKDISPDGTKDKKSTDAVSAKQTAMEGKAEEQEPNLQLDLLFNKENRLECNDFLQKEVTNYYDHKKAPQTESVEEVVDKKSKKGQGILQMFGIKQKSKDLDATEKSVIESKQSRDDKKKDKRKEASPLRIFGKKKSEEKSIKVSDITEKVEKDSDKFLQTEKDNYEDSLEPSHLVTKATETITKTEVVAEPVNGSVLKDKLTKEETIFEEKDKQTPSQNETVVATDTDLLKEALPSLQFDVLINEENRLQCNDFLQKEVKNYYDNKENLQTKPEEDAVDKKSKKSHGILQMFGIKQKSKDVEVSENEEESKQSKNDKKKDKKQKRKEASPIRIFGRMQSTEQSVFESSEQHKKESDEPLQTVTEHTQDSIKQPIESITKIETVRMSPHEIVPKDIVLASEQKYETSTASVSDSPQKSQSGIELHTLVSKENRSQCDDFLQKEVTNYYDHKETLPVEELVDKKTSKSHGILQMFGIKQKSKDVEALQKDVIETKQPKDGHIIDKLKEVSPMRIFGKKKSDEKPSESLDMTEDTTEDSNKFLKTEKENYEDSIKQLTVSENTASTKIKDTFEVITHKEQADELPNLEFDTLINEENRIQCNDFLQKEVINYYDHKQMLPEQKEVDTKSKGQGILRIFGIKQKSKDLDALDKKDIVDQQPTDEKIKHKKDKRKDTSPMRIFGKKKSEEQPVKTSDIEQIKEESQGFLQTEKVNYEDSSKPVSKIISMPSEEITSEITTKTLIKAPSTEIVLDKKITIEPETRITNGTTLKPETEIDLSSLITEENRNQCNEFLGKEVQNYYDYKDSPKIEEHTEKKHKKGTGILQRFGLKQKSKDISETIDKEEVEKQEKKKDKRKDVSPMRAIFGKKVKSEDTTKEQKEEPEKTKIISPKETVEKHFKTETIDIVETISEEPFKKDYEIESSTAKADLKQEVKIATKIGETLDATKKEIDETPVKHGEMKTKEIHETDEFILKEKTNYEEAVKDKEVQELSPTFEDSLILKKEPILTEQLTEPTTISPEREFNVYSIENRVYCKNFLNNEVDKYFDKGPKPLNEQKEEKSGILSFFGKKKSKDKEADKKEITKITSPTSKDNDKKEKRGSPLKIFSKKQKSEEVLESTKPVDVTEAPEKTNDFIILEKENYDHAETVIPEVKPIPEKVPPKEEVTSESIVKESVTTDEKNFTDEYKLDKISTDIVTDIDTGIETIITTKQEKFVETNKNVTTITERTSGVEEKKTIIDDVRLEDLSKYIESSDIFDLKPGETYEETKVTVEKTQSSKPPNKEPEQDQVHEQVPDDLCAPQARNDCHNFLSKEKEHYYDHKTIIPEQVDEKEHRKSGAGILSFFGLGKSKDSEKVKEKKEAKSSKKDDKKEKQAPSKIFGVKQKSEDKVKEDVKEIRPEPKVEIPEIVTVKKSDVEQPKTETKIEKHVTENEDGSIVTQTIITTEQSFPKTNEFLQKEVIHYQDSKITKPQKSSKITEPKEEKTEELKIVTVPQASEQATLIESFAETSEKINEKLDETITCKDFIQNELENYYDHKDKPEASQEIKDAKKSSGIKSFFGIKQYSKESDHEEIEKQTDKATKQERRKSGSPLRIFGKKQKSEDLPTLKSQLSRDKSEEKSLPEGPELHEKKRTSIIDKIVGKYKEHDEKDVNEKTKIKSPDEELEHEKKKGFLGKLSDKISGKGVKDSKIDDATHTYVSASIREELKSEKTPLVPTLSIDEVLRVEIPDDQTTDHHESITLMSPHEDDLNLTRTVSDYIVAAGEDEPFRKISETNIDLSNLPQDVDDYKIVKQKLIATKSFSDSSSPKADENHEDGKPVTRIMVTTTLETRSPKDEKKKLFHISSEDDDLQDTVGASEEKIATKEDLENIISSLETQLNKDLSDATKVVTKTTTTTTKVVSEPIDIAKVTSVTEVEAIEQKLRDIDQALGSLEHENILDDAVEHKLRRIERKFEHMASDAKLEAAKVETQKIKNENEFQNLLSQISVEEIADSQNEYNDIWNDLTFSKSEDVDSKTPDSQADVLDLPKGDIVYLGPVTLNKGNLVNKAGIEVDIIPIRKSPCSTPIQTRRRFPTPNLGRKRVIKSKNEARAVSSGDIFNLVVKMNPDRFLYSSNDSNNNINPSDGDFANKHKGSMCSLQEGSLVNTLSSWWDTSQSCSNIKNLCESSTQPRILVTSEDLNLNRLPSNFPKKSSTNERLTEPPSPKTNNVPQPKPRNHVRSFESTPSIPEDATVGQEEEKPKSPVRDDLLDDVDQSEVSYVDRKKFWESMVDQQGAQHKRMSLCDIKPIEKEVIAKKRTSVHDIAPLPKPRTMPGAQSSLELDIKDKVETKDLSKKEEDEESPRDYRMMTEYQASFVSPKEQKPKKISEIKREDSLDSEYDESNTNAITGDNTGYISDSGDVEHYISDSEIEDRVPQIRERQMSVFEPPAAYSGRKTIYERSASLPTEDLYEVCAKSAKLRKQYYEEQIKKELIEEQLNSEIDDEMSPERKVLSEDYLIKQISKDEETTTSGAYEQSDVTETHSTSVSTTTKSDVREVHFEKSEVEDLEKDIETVQVDPLQLGVTTSDEAIPDITVTLSGKQRRISEESDEYAEKDTHVDIITPVSEKCEDSPINQPKENIDDVVWEVSVQSQPSFDEKVSEITSEPNLVVGAHEVEEQSSSTRDESDFAQDHSTAESMASDRIKSESQNDIEKIILESLYQQKVDPSEAVKIAGQLVHEIESEIQKREQAELELQSDPNKEEVSDYLKQLAEIKGLDEREVELVQSVLSRRQRELAKLARADTQASSMEITDEELRYSGGDMDYSHILEQQMGQLEAENLQGNKIAFEVLNKEKQLETSEQIKEEIQTYKETKESTETTLTKYYETAKNEKQQIILEEDETVTDSTSDPIDKHTTGIKPDILRQETTIDDTIDAMEDYFKETKVEHKPQATETEWFAKEISKPLDESITESKVQDQVEHKHIQDYKHETESMATKIVTDATAEIKTESTKTTQSISSILTEDVMTNKVTSSEIDVENKLDLQEETKTTEILPHFKFESKTSVESESSSDSKKTPKDELNLRKFKLDDTSSSSSKEQRKSGAEFESYSSSGESHYHSFDVESGKSRPCSSDVEGLVADSSEYVSAISGRTEYHSAVGTLSSKASMKSLDSESSGNFASVEVSEASETLVPTSSELEVDMLDVNDQQLLLEDSSDEQLYKPEFQGSSVDISQSDEEQQEIQSKMKRSHEMTFQPQPKPLADSPQTESIIDLDEKFGSLDEGSILSMSVSSTSSAQLRTVIELSKTDESMTTSGASEMQISADDLALRSPVTPTPISQIDMSTSTKPNDEQPIESVTMMTASVSENGTYSASTQVTSEVSTLTGSVEEPKKRGHRRTDSTSFHPSMIKLDHSADKKSEEGETVDAQDLRKKSLTEIHPTKGPLEKRDSHGKSSGNSSEKSSFDEAEAEAAFNMVAHISPAHKVVTQICPILEDEDAEKHELEIKEKAQKALEARQKLMREQSPQAIPDIKVTEHITPFRDDSLDYLQQAHESEEHAVETPASVSSKSSEDTDQGQEYVLEDSKISEDVLSESKSEVGTVVETTLRETDSPNSDSFEMLDKPDIIDDFVVIEEVGKEAHEFDSEGKSVSISNKAIAMKSTKKTDKEVEDYLVKSAPPTTTKMNVKYFPQEGGSSSDEMAFDFEESPPMKSDTSDPEEYNKELEENRKWIEQQFQGDQAAIIAAGYGYEMEFERGPLEDIKEEDINDLDSRIGSLSSQKNSGGSLGSVKDSYSSTPEYDVLAGRKYFTRSGEHDDVSMSSLQEFESLEKAMSLEAKKCHSSGSHESPSNGSFKSRYYASKSGQNDDISVSSLKEFEGLEKACIAAHTIECKVKEEEALLSQIDEAHEGLTSESESITTVSGTDKKIPESDEEDYEKRMFEIDEIIRQAQTNVERFSEIKEVEKTESLGRGDSIEEVSKVPDLELDKPLKKPKVKSKEEDETMINSTDSLDLKPNKPPYHDSTDSLDIKTSPKELMTTSTDSIEAKRSATTATNIMTDSIEASANVFAEKSSMITSDSLELGATHQGIANIDSFDDKNLSSSSTGKDFSSSVREDLPIADYMLESTDSMEPTSSTATHATYQYETDSVFSGSFTSGGSNTMVSSTTDVEGMQQQSVDIAAACKKVWFDEDVGSSFTSEYVDLTSKPYVTEVIEPCEDGSDHSYTIHRRVELPTEVRKLTFSGPDAEEQMRKYMQEFEEGETTQETEEIDASGNVHVRKVVQKRVIMQPDAKAPTNIPELTKTSAGEASTSEAKEHPQLKAQAFRRRPLRYDISVDDQIEVDPREHDWLFNYSKDEKEGEASSSQTEQSKSNVPDQHQLSDEMKNLLKELEKESKQ